MSEALAFEARARRRVAPLVAEARAWLEQTDPADASHAAAEAAFREYAALLIRIDVRLAEYRRRVGRAPGPPAVSHPGGAPATTPEKNIRALRVRASPGPGATRAHVARPM
jgi:hypothetical protein